MHHKIIQAGGNIAMRFNIFPNNIVIKTINESNIDGDLYDLHKYGEMIELFKKKFPENETIYNVLSFPSMILTESAKKILTPLFAKMTNKNTDNLKQLVNKQYFKNEFESVSVYEFIYVLKFINLHKKNNILFVALNSKLMNGFIEYANDRFDNKFDSKNILLLHPQKIQPFTKKYHVAIVEEVADSNIFNTLHTVLTALETDGTLIIHMTYIKKKSMFGVICVISKMFKKQAIFKENDFSPVGSLKHYIVFKGFQFDDNIINSLKKIATLNSTTIKITSNLEDNDYVAYQKIVDEEINKSIARISDTLQIMTSDKLNVDDFIKMIKMNYDYSLVVVRNKFSDINIMHPFVWEKTDTYMLDIFNSIENEDVKGHMYIIESRNSDIVNDEYINIVKKQLRYINEYTYQYVSKSNYKKYKQAELFFNSEYKVLNKQLAIEHDITINGNYVSRAWMKMYEMIIQCNFVESLEQKITGFHICEAPGNFINAMIYYIHSKNKQYEWHAQSLNPDLPGNKDAFMDEYGFMKQTKKNWDFGIDNTGDILNLENFKYYIDKYKGVDVLIGDCGEQWTGEKKKIWPDKSDKHIGVRDLGTCQMLYALNIPRTGGNCIIKTYSGNLNPVFLTLLELMVSSYARIIFFKSNLNFWSAEVYIVGINFLGPNKNIEKMTDDFIKGSLSPLPKISRYTFSQYVSLSEKILHQVFIYKTFFVYCSLFPNELDKNKNEFQKIIKRKLDDWMRINFKHLK